MGFYNVIPDKNIPIDIIFKYIVDIAVAILFGVFVMHFMGMKVPKVLLSGDHKKVEQWREEESLKRTRERRPDLL